jgi:hypothetical protein
MKATENPHEITETPLKPSTDSPVSFHGTIISDSHHEHLTGFVHASFEIL